MSTLPKVAYFYGHLPDRRFRKKGETTNLQKHEAMESPEGKADPKMVKLENEDNHNDS